VSASTQPGTISEFILPLSVRYSAASQFKAPELVQPAGQHGALLHAYFAAAKGLADTVGLADQVAIQQGHLETLETQGAHRVMQVRQSRRECTAGPATANDGHLDSPALRQDRTELVFGYGWRIPRGCRRAV
jgi:hypothetical protein